jgi:hypothetical protein
MTATAARFCPAVTWSRRAAGRSPPAVAWSRLAARRFRLAVHG